MGAVRTTRVRAVRNFHFAGRDVRAGELLDLDDAEVQLLLAMPGTIELVDQADRRRLRAEPRLTWGPPSELAEPEPVRMRIRAPRPRSH